MKISSLFVLLGMTLSSALPACQVTLNGEDITEKLFVLDDATGEKYVDCMEKSKCRDVVITDCADVRCGGTEACNSAQIINFTESVLCEGLHACHRTEMLAAVIDGQQQTVSCLGSGACDVAQISGETIELVSCSGVKACRKVFVEGAKLVKCHDGAENTPACEGFATLETNCLYCGKNGCADHINMCRFKIIGEGVSEYKRYETCMPKEVVGSCPDGLEEELRLELEGREEIDGTR
jgi:hypothetical protein